VGTSVHFLFSDSFQIGGNAMTFSRKMMVAVLAVLLFVMVFDVCAQWPPGKTVINLGDLNLAVPPKSTAETPAGDSPITIPAGNSSDIINASMNNTTINNTTINNTTINNTLTASPIESLQPKQSATLIDLSNYSKDRRDKNRTGYKNIMYPEARGSTASTSGGGSGGGCGC
jgi:hypothetical protein